MSFALNAVKSLVNQYQPNQAFADALAALFEQEIAFLEKVNAFDDLFAKNQAHEPVKEYAFDLLMAYHLEMNQEDEDYFDTPEWQDIEDKTLERGTELLNMLLYITEANDTDSDVNIEDFLYEFLLVDEDEFQDEHRIYEELIANQDLVEENIGSIVEVAKRMPDELEIKELFIPLLLFFKEPTDRFPNREFASKINKLELALLACLLAYHNG